MQKNNQKAQSLVVVFIAIFFAVPSLLLTLLIGATLIVGIPEITDPIKAMIAMAPIFMALQYTASLLGLLGGILLINQKSKAWICFLLGGLLVVVTAFFFSPGPLLGLYLLEFLVLTASMIVSMVKARRWQVT